MFFAVSVESRIFISPLGSLCAARAPGIAGLSFSTICSGDALPYSILCFCIGRIVIHFAGVDLVGTLVVGGCWTVATEAIEAQVCFAAGLVVWVRITILNFSCCFFQAAEALFHASWCALL